MYMRVYYASRCVGNAELSETERGFCISAKVSGVPEGPFRLAAEPPDSEVFNLGVMMPCAGGYALKKQFPKADIDKLGLNASSKLFIVYPGQTRREASARPDFASLGFSGELAERLNECGELISLCGVRMAAFRIKCEQTDSIIHLCASARIIKSGGEYYLAYKLPNSENKTGKN